TKASKTLSVAASQPGAKLILLPLPECQETRLPKWEELKTYYKNIRSCIADGSITAASVVKEGGAAAAAAKMVFGNKLGIDFTKLSDQDLFAPRSGWIVAEAKESVLDLFAQAKVLGTITENDYVA